MDWRKTRTLGGSLVAPTPVEKPDQAPGSVSDVRLSQPSASDKPPPPPDFSKTQVLPVEEVAKVLGPRRVGAQRAAFDGARTQRLTALQLRAPPRARGRWRGWVLAGVLAMTALGAYAALRGGIRPRANESPGGSLRARGHANGARPVAPTVGAAPAPPVEPSRSPAASPSAALPDRRSVPPANARAVSQRSAVDALAAGDAARAAALYAALAAREPHDRALSAAARILHGRLARAQPP